jgi:hypothetical protein
VPKELDVLEGARDAPLRDPTRPRAGELSDFAVEEADRPLLRPVQAAGAVQQARLTGAVGPDDRVDVALAHAHVDARERLDGAEAETHRVGLELELALLEVTPVQVVLVRPGHVSPPAGARPQGTTAVAAK